jgi:hypothetical protein
MKIINVDIMPDGRVEVTANGYDTWLKNQPRRCGPGEIWHVVFKSDDEQQVVVTDARTLTETAQYNIGWHDGYRAQFNEKNNVEYLEKDKRMVASLKPEQKDSIGG